ncbi:MAG: T9SS type A sorting domain-containing protein [Bacteroidales bacterium]|nr:T9SS type A sorting domain-containing protein [Bacteroidales bacterium]
MTTKLNNPSLAATANKNLKTKTKRALALLMFALLAPAVAQAQFGGGSGTETDPYLIATTDHMDALASQVNGGNSFSGTYFLMTADLDYSGKSYTPVAMPFRGSYDGGGHTITNVILSGVSDTGIFGIVSWGGIVENLTLDQSSIGYRGYNLGGIAGVVEGATLRNCINKASITANDYQYDGKYIGGVAGVAISSSIIDCQNYGNVDGCYSVGGIVGGAGSNTLISGCQNHGYVNRSGGYLSEDIGGIVGDAENSSISHCKNTGRIHGYYTGGGIIGYAVGCTVSHCFNLGYVETAYERVGGIVGHARTSSVSNCLNLSSIRSGSGYVKAGGIVGWNDGTENTYANNYHRESYYGGIEGTNVPGQAMYGYAVSGEEGITVSLVGSIGLAYEGIVYAGNEQSVALNISAPVGYIPSDGYSASAGTLTPSGSAYTLVMPGEDVSITANLVKVKSFAAEGNWCEAANWMPNGVPTLEDDIYLFANATVPQGCVAEANSITIVGGNTLTIEDGGQLKSNSDVNATIKKHITGYGESTDGGWYLVGFPTSVFPGPEPTALGLITTESDFDFYFFANNFPDGLEWRNYKAGAITTIQAMLRYGYLYANASDMDIVLSNSLNASAADVVISLIYTGNYDFKGWHLHGNPFPCDAYVYDNATGAYRSFYRMNTDGDGLIPATGVVHPMEGFFTQATTTGEKIRISRNPIVAQSNLLSIDLVEGNANTNRDGSTPAATDRAIIRFGEGNTLEKFSLSDRTSKIYIPHGGKDYAVATVGRDAPWHVSTTDEIPVNFKAAKNGTYTLTFDTQNLDLDYLHLIDNMTGADVDLLSAGDRGSAPAMTTEGVSYTFTARTTDYASRFRLVFSRPADGPSARQTFAFISNGEIIIDGAETQNFASLQIVDMMGRVIVCRDGVHTVSTNGMAHGVYVLRLMDGENVRTQKIVIP